MMIFNIFSHIKIFIYIYICEVSLISMWHYDGKYKLIGIGGL